MRGLARYLAALVITLVVEVPIYTALLRFALDVPSRRGASWGTGVNLFSHPLGFLVLAPALTSLVGSSTALVLVELWAWTSEAALLVLGLRRQLLDVVLVSLAANGASLAVGLTVSIGVH